MFRAIQDAAAAWSRHNAPRLGAALAYLRGARPAPAGAHSMATAICTRVSVRKQSIANLLQMRDIVGSQIAGIIEDLLKSAAKPTAGILATLLGFATMIVGASGVFVELRDILNYIWDAPPKATQGFRSIIRDRFLSFAMVIGAGVLLTASLAVTVIVQSADAYSGRYFSLPPSLLETSNFLVTLTLTSVVFALMCGVRRFRKVHVDWEEMVMASTDLSLTQTVVFSG